MRMRSFAVRLVFLTVLFASMTGCGNKIADFYTQKKFAGDRPVAGLAHYYVIYESYIHYEPNSLAGLLESGLIKLTGNESRDRMTKAGIALRQRLIGEADTLLKPALAFSYKPLDDTTREAKLRLDKKKIAAYAAQNNLDLVIAMTSEMTRGGDFLFGLDLHVSNMWDVYDRNGQYLGGIRDTEKARFGKWVYDYDARDPRFADLYSQLLNATTQKVLGQFTLKTQNKP